MKAAAAMLRSLADEKSNYLEYENALAKKRDEIASLRAKLERARETLEWYADPDIYGRTIDPLIEPMALIDKGDSARATLEEIK